jgi:hypothetical protein
MVSTLFIGCRSCLQCTSGANAFSLSQYFDIFSCKVEGGSSVLKHFCVLCASEKEGMVHMKRPKFLSIKVVKPAKNVN